MEISGLGVVNSVCLPLYVICFPLYDICSPLYDICSPLYVICLPLYDFGKDGGMEGDRFTTFDMALYVICSRALGRRKGCREKGEGWTGGREGKKNTHAD